MKDSRKFWSTLLLIEVMAACVIWFYPVARPSATGPVAGSNLIFQATAITDVSTGKQVPLGGSGNVRTTGDFYFVSGTPSLVALSDPTYQAVDNQTVLEQREATFMVDTWMYTTAPWDRACAGGAVPQQGSYDWFKTQSWIDYYWGDQKTGGLKTSTIRWDDYALKPAVYANHWSEYASPVIQLGWASNLFNWEWTHPNASSGISVKYKFDYQFTNVYPTSAAKIMDIGEYSDTLIIQDQQIGVDVNNFDNVNPQVGAWNSLTTAQQNALRTQDLFQKLGVVVTQNPNANDYRAWTAVQTATLQAPGIGFPFLSAGDRPAPNTGTSVTLHGYSIKPSVYAATQTFVINWGAYDICTETGWDVSGQGCVGQVEQSTWPNSNQGGLATSNSHGQVTKTRTVADHVANKAVEQPYAVKMLVSSTVALDGVTAAQWLGQPQLVQDNKTWLVFFTGDTKAGVDFLATYDWNDFMHDVGLGINAFMSAFLGPVITIIILIVVVLAVVYILPSLFKRIGQKQGQATAAEAERRSSEQYKER